MTRQTRFDLAEETALAADFLRRGYVIMPVEDGAALDEIRAELVRIAATEANLDAGDDPAGFLNGFHRHVNAAQINDIRVATYNGMNANDWFRPTYFGLVRRTIETLVGNELAMQNKINLSIQMPHDTGSVLSIHADQFDGQTPFEVVAWLPMVDVHDTKSMFIITPEKNREMMSRLSEFEHVGMQAVFEEVRGDATWLKIPYGHILVFTPTIMHGNVANEVDETRWSFNTRFTGLFTPFTDIPGSEKRLGGFYLPITPRAVTRIGMTWEPPGGFGRHG